MFETGEWDDDDTPQLSALTWAAARREDDGSSKTKPSSDSDTHTDKGRKVKRKKEKIKKAKVEPVLKKLTDDTGNGVEGCVSKISGGASEKVEGDNTGEPEKTAGGKKKSKRKERKNSALAEISRKVLNSIDSKANSPGQEKALLEDSINSEVFADEERGDDNTEDEVGSILKKGIKFSSAEAFLRFIGLPGKGKRGKKRILEENEEKERGRKQKKEKRGQTEEGEDKEETSDEEGEENLAFKAETPAVKESDMKSLNMGRLKEHLSTQESKSKEEDAAAQQMNKATNDSPLTSAAKQKLTASRF